MLNQLELTHNHDHHMIPEEYADIWISELTGEGFQLYGLPLSHGGLCWLICITAMKQLLTWKRHRNSRKDRWILSPLSQGGAAPWGSWSLGENVACKERLTTAALGGAKGPPMKFPALFTVTKSCAKSCARSLCQ